MSSTCITVVHFDKLSLTLNNKQPPFSPLLYRVHSVAHGSSQSRNALRTAAPTEFWLIGFLRVNWCPDCLILKEPIPFPQASLFLQPTSRGSWSPGWLYSYPSTPTSTPNQIINLGQIQSPLRVCHSSFLHKAGWDRSGAVPTPSRQLSPLPLIFPHISPLGSGTSLSVSF